MPRGASFPKGTSGNPKGRPKRSEDQRQAIELARDKSADAIRFLISVYENPKMHVQARISAAKIVLDRGLGLPTAPKEEMAVSGTRNVIVEYVVKTSTAPPIPAAPQEDMEDMEELDGG